MNIQNGIVNIDNLGSIGINLLTMKNSLQDRILCILKSTHIPWEQGALLWRINRYTDDKITMIQLARALARLKSSHQITRVSWRTPSDGNIWELKNDSRAYKNRIATLS